MKALKYTSELSLKNVIAMFFLLVVLVGCSTKTTTLQGKLPAMEAPKASGEIRAGAAKIDITPPAGFPMGGHSISGEISRGHWLRLYARSLYIESPDGSKLALVAADLWSMPAGLADHVTEILGKNPNANCRFGRNQLVFAATHTHQSPGNFSSSQLYNYAGSNQPGFDRDLLDFLSERLAKAVADSCKTAEAAKLQFISTQVKGLGRNRSIEAFLKNPEAQTILDEGKNLPEGYLPPIYSRDELKREFHAIDPGLQTLWIRSANKASRIIGVGAFTAVHPTALNHSVEIYSSDLFGVASIRAERALDSMPNVGAPVVAIFNGAEGDVSSAWINQGRQDVLSLGKILGDAILKTGGDNSANSQVIGEIQVNFVLKPLAGVQVDKYSTNEQAKGQAAAFAGAEDGRSPWYAYYLLGCQEGWDISITQPTSWPKPLCWLVHPLISSYVASSYPAPKSVPLGVYRFGPIAFATLPGEFTTTMGRRIRKDLEAQLNIEKNNIVLIGLTNEYVSYFTTPEEYKENHYEGGMTLYGKDSGPLVGSYLGELAQSLGDATVKRTEYSYDVGNSKKFTAKDLSTVGVDDLKSNILQTMFPEGRETPEMLGACWDGPAPSIAEAKAHGWNATSSVEVETQLAGGSWQPLMDNGCPVNDKGLDVIIQLSEWKDLQSRWCAFYLPSSELKTGPLRFKVTSQDHSVHLLPLPKF